MATVKGRLVGAETRVGIPFVIVSLNGLTTSTNHAGDFQLNVLPRPSPFTLTVRSPLHKPVSLRISVPQERVYDLGVIDMITAIFSRRDVL